MLRFLSIIFLLPACGCAHAPRELTLAHDIRVPSKWRGGSEQPWMPDRGPIHRYVEAYDRGWWRAVEKRMTNIDYQETYEEGVPTAIGWIEEVQGFSDGYWAAVERLERLIGVFGKRKTSEYLQQFRLNNDK